VEGRCIMPSNTLSLLVLATIALFFGHTARALRWSLLFPPHYLSSRFNLLLGLSLGYAVNAIFPWRFGEIIRTFFVSSRETESFSFIAATVVAERLTDLLVISIIMLVAWQYSQQPSQPMLELGLFMLVTAITGFAFTLLVRHSKTIRQLIWRGSSIFNEDIHFSIIDFIWNISELILGGKVFSRQYLLITLLMWLIYSASYFIYGAAVGVGLVESFYAQFNAPLMPLLTRILNGDIVSATPLLVFSILPIFGVIAYGFTRQWPLIVLNISAKWRYGNSISATHLNSARERFKKDNEFRYFLTNHFSGRNQVLSNFGLFAMQDGVIQRIYNGGSEAITALVEIDQKLAIRKFAVGTAAQKLQQQAVWIKSYQNCGLPIVHINNERQENGFYFYDMPFVVPANEYYDVIHTAPIETSKSLLETIVTQISLFHQRNATGIASNDIMENYFREKIINNVGIIMDFAKNLLPHKEYCINGKMYSLQDWRVLTDVHWLTTQTLDRKTSVIHGDLTIENIILSPQYPSGFYIIDPNPENIFNTPLIDFAKLMQSLHLGYEGLNRGRMSAMTDNGISLSITRSMVYSDLQDHFEQLIISRFGEETLREIYFHELVNYLRLTPYKIRKHPMDGLTFFACTSILLERYLKRGV